MDDFQFHFTVLRGLFHNRLGISLFLKMTQGHRCAHHVLHYDTGVPLGLVGPYGIRLLCFSSVSTFSRLFREGTSCLPLCAVAEGKPTSSISPDVNL